MREQLAIQYLSGSGIEIGGLHNPLRVPEGCKVTYVDLAPTEEVAKANPDVVVTNPVNVVDNAETLATFADNSQDFVIANHVLEHCENPIKAFENWLRVLKPGGVIYAAIPEKNHTFDRKREVTTLRHLLADYYFEPDHSLEAHYRDWFMNSELEGVSGEELERKVSASMKARNNIHFHVFDFASMQELFSWFLKKRFPIEHYELHVNGSEVITITRKAS